MNTLALIFLALTAAPKSQGAEIVRPESYAIKRFQEVLKSETSDRKTPLQEQLITERAKLEVSKKKLAALEIKKDPSPKESYLRSARALVHHHELRVKKFEKKIRKKRNR